MQFKLLLLVSSAMAFMMVKPVSACHFDDITMKLIWSNNASAPATKNARMKQTQLPCEVKGMKFNGKYTEVKAVDQMDCIKKCEAAGNTCKHYSYRRDNKMCYLISELYELQIVQDKNFVSGSKDCPKDVPKRG